jgi:diguanylate cyclase (GGDEF)-like protein
MKSSFTLRLLLSLPTFSPWLTVPALILALLVVGVLDLVTGPDFPFSLFYYLGAAFATLVLGFRRGLAFAVAILAEWTTATWFSGNQSGSVSSFVWTEAARFLTLALLVFLVHRLQDAITELSLHALKDPLTGASNRRHFDDFFERTLRVARRYGRPLTMVSFDVDDFKLVNDTRGHPAGDAVLQALTSEIQERIRPEDLLARLGGDEFVLLLPDTSYEATQAILPRVFAAVTGRFQTDGHKVTLSVGVVTFARVPDGAAEVLAAVDAALYQAKRLGKAQLVHTAFPGPPSE